MKANRFLVATLFVATFFFATAFSAVAVSANAVSVYLDGVRLEFEDVQPQIINDRTMVPLRAVASHFGMEGTWDEGTATMFFTAPGRIMIHTVHTNVITVNGQETPFHETGMSSIIAGDRTLMPIRMLAEAIGHDVDWEPITRRVDIWTDQVQQAPPTQAPPAGQPAAPSAPATGNITVFSATVGRLDHAYGEPIVIHVATNNAADRVRVMGANNAELALVDEFTYDSQGRYFVINIYPTTHGEVTLQVFAGNAAGFVFNPQTLTVNVASAPPPPEEAIRNVILSGTGTGRNRFDTNSIIGGTFRTDHDIVRVRIEDDAGRQVDQSNRYISSTRTHRTWEFDFNAPNRNGTFTYYIVALDSNNDYVRLPFEIIVGTGTGTGSSNNQPAGHRISINSNEVYDVFIYNRDGSNNHVRTGDRVRFYVVTHMDVTEVEVSHPENAWIYGTRSSTTQDSRRTFRLEFVAEFDGANYSLRIFDDWGSSRETRLSGFSVSHN